MTAKEPISVTHPELAIQAVGWNPSQVTAGSHKRLEWVCKLGHTWIVAPNQRRAGYGCPVCSGQKVLAGFNDLATTDPEIAKQAHGWDPTTLTRASGRDREWQCKLGHVWTVKVASRSRGSGCAVCAGQKVLAGFNDLCTTHPEIAEQAHGWDPTTVTRGSDFMGEWQCEYGHVWTAVVGKRTRGNGCPTCSGHKLLVGYNDLATTEPELAEQAFEWDPKTVSRSSDLSMTWRCEQGHIWSARVADRSAGNGCPVCSGLMVVKGVNDLASTNPNLALQAIGWDPSTVTAGSSRRRDWKCELGHVWTATILNRSRGSTCGVCSGQRVLVGFNDLTTTDSELAAQAFGWDPTTVTAGSSRLREWKCELGHVWTSTIYNRTRGSSCGVCSGRRVLQGFNDLSTTDPELARQAVGWDPSTVTRGSDFSGQWECEYGHHWFTTVKGRTNGRGCPTCSKSGFDPNSEGWLYFLSHPRWQMFQIGITNFPDDRLKSHKKLGWELIELRGPMDGLIAREWETSILQMLKRHGAKLAPKEIAGKFDGYTEAWLIESFRAESLRVLMDAVENDETMLNKSE